MDEKGYVNLRELVGELVDKYAKRTAWGSWEKSLVDSILTTICRFPAADVVEVRHGEWTRIEVNGKQYGQIYYQHKECSVNETQLFPSPYDYCPNCGAKMDGGKNDDK